MHKNALVLGKFMPFHKGHKYLIDTAIGSSEKVQVLVCTLEKEPIDGDIRYDWVNETYKHNPNVNIVHVTDNVPSYPEEDPENFWDIWVDLFNRYVPNVDVVFTSEDYGDEIASRLGIEHVLVDKDRQLFPVSGTDIRKNPYKNWKYISKHVRPYYTKKIAIVGPESTGKSTLAKTLADYYDVDYVEEYGRTYTEENFGKNKLSLSGFSIEDIRNIAIGHDNIYREVISNSRHKVVFFDTEFLVTKVWSEIYFNGYPPILDEMDQSYDLYLLLDIDIPWDDDGTREFPEFRECHFMKLWNELEDNDCLYRIVSGDGTARVKKSIDYVNKLLEGEL